MSLQIGNLDGRLVLLAAGRAQDVATASEGRFGPDPMSAYEDWDAFLAWARGEGAAAGEAFSGERLGASVPRPGAIYAIGLNYRDHAEEAKLEVPGSPMVFTKFRSCLAGPEASVPLPSERVDWEAELVVVIGRHARAVDVEDALGVVAGYCVGQDVSDRRLQFKDQPPQFSLGKSLPGFGPIGPVTPLADLADPLDLAISCDLDGERVQESRTSQMVFPVPELVSFLSGHGALEPGDLIFTGTPGGVGSVRKPRRYLRPGEMLVTAIEGLAPLRNRCVAGAA